MKNDTLSFVSLWIFHSSMKLFLIPKKKMRNSNWKNLSILGTNGM
uniref:Uncharacterized protein n=1 Tax=Cucumis melo TaxID=3656 RepID=A0A9I9ECE3_CUCME